MRKAHFDMRGVDPPSKVRSHGGKMHEYTLITSLSTSDVISILDPIKGSTALEPFNFKLVT